MPNNYLSVLYKHIIQVENKNVGLKVCVCVWGGGGGHKYTMPPPLQSQKWGAHAPLAPASYASDIYIPSIPIPIIVFLHDKKGCQQIYTTLLKTHYIGLPISQIKRRNELFLLHLFSWRKAYSIYLRIERDV